MRQASLSRVGVFGLGLAIFAATALPAHADEFAIDPVHSSVTFKAHHMGISWVHGRFNTFTGNVSFDKADPAKASFELTIKTDSVDTGNKMRDGHLANADFFDAKQFANIIFKSTSVKPAKDGFDVEGELTMHGTTKKIKFLLHGGKDIDIRGKKVVGFWTDLTLKRTEFGMNKMLEGVGDEVPVSISFEAGKK